MYDAHSNERLAAGASGPAARYLSSSDIQSLLQLLVELKDSTLSLRSHQRAASLIVELSGSDRSDYVG